MALERSGNEIADAGKKVDAHAWVKPVGVGTADTEETELGIAAQWHECDGADLIGVAGKQEIPLRVAHLAAARSAAG